jgi:putative oxidoreductase
MRSLAFLLLRFTLGGLLMGHGAQKLFGWFEGPGPEGTAGMMRSMGLQPARPWAMTASLGEFGGGLLTALGLLNPLGPLGVIGAMSMATGKAHWGKPIWASKGGAELPVTNIGIALALAVAGPGRYSLDQALGLRLPRWLLIPGLLGVAAVTALGMSQQPQPQPAATEQPATEQPAATAAPSEPRPAAVPSTPEPPPAPKTPQGRVTEDLTSLSPTIEGL